MLDALAGFPLNLIPALLVLAVYRPSIPWVTWPALATLILALGFLYPIEAQINFWSAGGTAALSILLAGYLYFYPKEELASDRTTSLFGDRRMIRETLSKTVSLEERQQIYINFVSNRRRNLLRMEEKITPLNTKYFTGLLFLLFILTYSVMALKIFPSETFLRSQEETISTAMRAYQEYLPDQPEDANRMIEEATDEAFALLKEYAIISVFFTNLLYALFFLSLCSTLMRIRKMATTNFGIFSFYKLPEMATWTFVGLIALVIGTEQLFADFAWSYIPINLLGILTLLYVLQGMGTLWLYFHVRLMPGGSILILVFLLGFIFPYFLVVMLFVFFLLGVLEFWFDFRKKALHPKMLSNDAL